MLERDGGGNGGTFLLIVIRSRSCEEQIFGIRHWVLHHEV